MLIYFNGTVKAYATSTHGTLSWKKFNM